ncbi:MAG: SulP family inorganic anion transporter [Salinivirgaceae bacterium]|jgi:SulP family sulfate permease|nr:STAS domain-containing protein [Bacteroidales bacterium]
MNEIFRPKLFTVLKKGITKEQLTKDILAGVIVGIVALPLSIAFAVASGVSPEKGLVTAIIAGFIISFLGGSRVQIGGPTGAFIVILFGIVTQYGLDGLMLSTILAGVLLIAFGLLKLGALLKFFPYPLIVGFTSGIALVIFSTQIKDALGLSIESVPSDFFEKWSVYISALSTFNITAIALTVLTILISVYSKKITTVVPGSFIAILVVTSIVAIFKLDVTTIGSIYGEIPSKISVSIPEIEWRNIGNYFAPAVTIALLGGIESLLSAVVADGMIGGHHRSNTELIAQGIANVVTPLFGGIPATGAIARTATNVKNGGRTPIAGIMHAITLLIIMLVFGKYAGFIPMSCLAGILIVVAYNMSEWRTFVSILRGSAFDIIILLSTFILTVAVDLTIAIQVGVVLSALLFMKRMSDIKPELSTSIDSDILDNYSDVDKSIGIYEISGPFFFASAKRYGEVIKTSGTKYKVLIIRMRHVPFIDSTGIKNLKEAVRFVQHEGTKVVLSGVNPQVHSELEKYRIVFMVGKANIFPEFSLALDRANQILVEDEEEKK